MSATYFTLNAHLNHLKRTLSAMESELSSLPSGSLCCKTIAGHDYYYQNLSHREDGQVRTIHKYLPESTSKEPLMRKRFIKASLPILRKNISILEKCLSSYRIYDPDEICASFPKAYKDIPQSSRAVSEIPDIADWLSAPYTKNPFYPESLVHTSISGEKVRSKSEALILGMLWTYRIPFRYEAALKLGDRTFYPDFTILHPVTKEVFYWEHFGLSGDQEYAFRSGDKLAHYEKFGLTLWNNLIISYDKPDGSLDVQKIDAIIRAFLL